MAYTILQSAHGNSSTGSLGTTPQTLAFGSNVTAGSLLLCVMDCGDGANHASVTDNNGNTWHVIATDLHDVPDGQFFSCWYTWNANAGATTVQVASPPVAATSCVIVEVGGILASSDPLRVVDGGTVAACNTTPNGEVSNPVTPTAGDFVFAWDNTGHAPQTHTAGTGYTLIADEPGAGGVTGATTAEWQTAAGGSQTATFTNNNATGRYGVGIAAFKPLVAIVVDPTLGTLRPIVRGRFQ